MVSEGDNVAGWYLGEGDAVSGELRVDGETQASGNIWGGYTAKGGALANSVMIDGSSVRPAENEAGEELAPPLIVGGGSADGDASDNRVTVTGGDMNLPDDLPGHLEDMPDISGMVNAQAAMLAGGMTENGAASGNTVLFSGSDVNDPDSFSEGLKDLAGEVPQTVQIAGGMAVNGDASGNTVIITGGTTVGGEAVIVGGVVGVTADESGQAEAAGAARDNTVILAGEADVSGAELYGWRAGDGTTEVQETSGNTLVIDNWSGSVKNAQNFDAVRFDSVTWEDGGTVLEATDGEDAMLADAEILADDLAIRGENTPQAGERMTFIKGTEASAGEQEGPLSFTKGTVTRGTAVMEQETAGSLDYVIQTVGLNPQTAAVNRGRLTGAAFVNQGADIAADAVSLLDDGYHWGTRTFGAVYGSRSEYDGAGGIRINGWNTIVGAGNVHEIKDGRLAWGVFYENGTGNYHTRNMFNNEIFRGDGSLLYNGGGAAVRLTKNGGSYYEASVRAGTLGNSMTDAVRDGDGNSYGFDSDSTYWGGHIGAGRLIPGSRGQWDVYGKYFHSEIEGDAFLMGGDAYRFEDMTSDRLRLGARYTADTGRAWSFYGGAAYEYEFSGDSRMKAGPWEAREESLQGSSVFGEIGVLMRDKDSPWSMDINLRGYTGEREGISGMLQLAYSF